MKKIVEEKVKNYVRDQLYATFNKILREKTKSIVAPMVEERVTSLAKGLEERIEDDIRKLLNQNIIAKLGKIEGYWISEIDDIVQQSVERQIREIQKP